MYGARCITCTLAQCHKRVRRATHTTCRWNDCSAGEATVIRTRRRRTGEYVIITEHRLLYYVTHEPLWLIKNLSRVGVRTVSSVLGRASGPAKAFVVAPLAAVRFLATGGVGFVPANRNISHLWRARRGPGRAVNPVANMPAVSRCQTCDGYKFVAHMCSALLRFHYHSLYHHHQELGTVIRLIVPWSSTCVLLCYMRMDRNTYAAIRYPIRPQRGMYSCRCRLSLHARGRGTAPLPRGVFSSTAHCQHGHTTTEYVCSIGW
jgi:hypothetical protein